MRIKITLLFLFTAIIGFAQQDREVEYIKKNALTAVREMMIYKIPASITLAQGILETGGGQSRLANEANNHFGIKCKKEWTGEKIYHDDDALGECFRKYKTVEESYRDHSKFLAERPYYVKLFDLNPLDYKAWAHGLKKAGYATNPRYGHILISKIKKHRLNHFDELTEEDVYAKLTELYGPLEPTEQIAVVASKPEKANIKIQPIHSKADIEEVKKETKKMEVPKRKKTPRQRIKRHPIGREYIVVLPGETINDIAKTFKYSKKKLLRYNELDKPENLLAGQNLFFGKKKNKGKNKYYTVKEGESMYFIAQKTGIKLNKLYRLNRMKKGDQPSKGQRIYLRRKKPRN